MKTRQLSPGVTEETEFGYNTLGIPFRNSAMGGWERVDLYTSKSTGEQFRERRFAESKEDYSPMARTLYAGNGNCEYHPQCECCWLGFSHTLALHNKRAFDADGNPRNWE